MRQIARDLKLQVNSVRRELENLEGINILFSENDSGHKKDGARIGGRFVQGNGRPVGRQDKKFFRINPEFILYEELRALIVKAQILYERDFIKKLKTAGQIKLLVFAGRFVNIPSSAIDMLVVGRFRKPRLYKFIKQLEDELGQEINFTLMSDREFKYRRDITDVFLYNILEGKKIVAIDEYGAC